MNVSPYDKDSPNAIADLVRDLFNPYGETSFRSEWRSEWVVGIAHNAYETRDFSLLPILADAFLDAGCDNEWLLQHCSGQEVCPACVGVGVTEEDFVTIATALGHPPG